MECSAENVAAHDLIDRLAFAIFGGSRDVWDRVPAEREHYLRTAGLLLPIVVDVWDEGNDAGYSDGHSDVPPSSQAANPYRALPPGKTP